MARITEVRAMIGGASRKLFIRFYREDLPVRGWVPGSTLGVRYWHLREFFCNRKAPQFLLTECGVRSGTSTTMSELRGCWNHAWGWTKLLLRSRGHRLWIRHGSFGVALGCKVGRANMLYLRVPPQVGFRLYKKRARICWFGPHWATLGQISRALLRLWRINPYDDPRTRRFTGIYMRGLKRVRKAGKTGRA